MTKTPKPKLEALPIASIVESPWNPRKHFDPIAQKNLEASMGLHGQLVPGTVRPIAGGKYELAAGTRRYRAAKALKVGTYLAIVRELTDAEFCEILTIDNDERSDVHPLEQANGYKLLMEKSGYDVAKIAERINRDHTYVYDRLRLLQLLPKLKELFLDGRFGLSQALVVAKLSDDDQRKVSAEPAGRWDGRDSGLWRTSDPTLDEKAFPLVAKTAAEIEMWIADHLRFDEKKIEVDELFPETAVALEAASESGVRVVGITYDEYLPQSIERDPKDKIYTSRFWKRADGLEGSKACDYAVVGIVRAGEGRGTSLGVCVSRESCKTHWAARVKELEAQKKAKGKGTASPKTKAKAEVAAKRAEAQRKKEEVREREATARAKAAVGPVKAELEKQIASGSKAMLAHARQLLAGGGERWKKYTLEQFVMALAVDRHVRVNEWSLTNDWQRKELVKSLRGFGIDLAKHLAAVTLEKPKAAPADAEEVERDDED